MKKYQCSYNLNGVFALLSHFLLFLSLAVNTDVSYNCCTGYLYFHAFYFLSRKCLKEKPQDFKNIYICSVYLM